MNSPRCVPLPEAPWAEEGCLSASRRLKEARDRGERLPKRLPCSYSEIGWADPAYEIRAGRSARPTPRTEGNRPADPDSEHAEPPASDPTRSDHTIAASSSRPHTRRPRDVPITRTTAPGRGEQRRINSGGWYDLTSSTLVDVPDGTPDRDDRPGPRRGPRRLKAHSGQAQGPPGQLRARRPADPLGQLLRLPRSRRQGPQGRPAARHQGGRVRQARERRPADRARQARRERADRPASRPTTPTCGCRRRRAASN